MSPLAPSICCITDTNRQELLGRRWYARPYFVCGQDEQQHRPTSEPRARDRTHIASCRSGWRWGSSWPAPCCRQWLRMDHKPLGAVSKVGLEKRALVHGHSDDREDVVSAHGHSSIRSSSERAPGRPWSRCLSQETEEASETYK
jgi:hypothetical protein